MFVETRCSRLYRLHNIRCIVETRCSRLIASHREAFLSKAFARWFCTKETRASRLYRRHNIRS
ncbi:MAG TPA: hypothetical protein ENF37_06935 [Beggiatoa sp.]|nr:hypothetical protein [Beggiatoa sp.]